ncbi:hypothetical protein G5S35_22250 [Paraburkholderia tropica]|uniref:hypothetical protein n=1 Tax=Paraburkholderia tropica TaxID=92647 RepID=UPI001602357B|nr:hypothetical protein [Paraburkholderia tropica]QNB14262.1 hypothetical protein G5S35_22250 [Paraburkholderia tropica]
MAFTVKVRPDDTTNMIGAGVPDEDLQWVAFEYDDLQWESVMEVLASKQASYLLSENGEPFSMRQA